MRATGLVNNSERDGFSRANAKPQAAELVEILWMNREFPVDGSTTKNFFARTPL